MCVIANKLHRLGCVRDDGERLAPQGQNAAAFCGEGKGCSDDNSDGLASVWGFYGIQRAEGGKRTVDAANRLLCWSVSWVSVLFYLLSLDAAVFCGLVLVSC